MRKQKLCSNLNGENLTSRIISFLTGNWSHKGWSVRNKENWRRGERKNYKHSRYKKLPLTKEEPPTETWSLLEMPWPWLTGQHKSLSGGIYWKTHPLGYQGKPFKRRSLSRGTPLWNCPRACHRKFLATGCCWPWCTTAAGTWETAHRRWALGNLCALQEAAESQRAIQSN